MVPQRLPLRAQLHRHHRGGGDEAAALALRRGRGQLGRSLRHKALRVLGCAGLRGRVRQRDDRALPVEGRRGRRRGCPHRALEPLWVRRCAPALLRAVGRRALHLPPELPAAAARASLGHLLQPERRSLRGRPLPRGQHRLEPAHPDCQLRDGHDQRARRRRLGHQRGKRLPLERRRPLPPLGLPAAQLAGDVQLSGGRRRAEQRCRLHHARRRHLGRFRQRGADRHRSRYRRQLDRLGLRECGRGLLRICPDHGRRQQCQRDRERAPGLVRAQHAAGVDGPLAPRALQPHDGLPRLRQPLAAAALDGRALGRSRPPRRLCHGRLRQFHPRRHRRRSPSPTP